MKYKISDAFIRVNGQDIIVGVVLGRENNPDSPFMTEVIPVSEYEKGVKEFKYGPAHIDDLVFHGVGMFENFKATRHIDEKWIHELALLGYDTSKLVNVPEPGDD